MELLFSNFNGTLSQALQIGISLGVVVGVVVFTIINTNEGRFRVFFGVFLGVILMGLLQTVHIYRIVDAAIEQNTLEIGSAQMDIVVQALINGFFRTIEAAIVGGLVMMLVFSPGEALRGALTGFILGTVVAIAGWALLGLFNLKPPNYLFALGLIMLGFILFDMISSRIAT